MGLSKIILFILICVFFTGTVHGSEEDRLYRIGVLAKHGKEECLAKWTPTARYLTGEIDGVKFKIVPLDFNSVLPAVKNEAVEFLLANPAYYVRAEIKYGTKRIATLKNLRLDHPYTIVGGTIITRTDRDDINNLDDLKGKCVAAIAENSFEGWITVWRELKRKGINPYSDFSTLTFVGSHDAVIYALNSGHVDAGVIKTNILEQMRVEGNITPGDFREIHNHREMYREVYTDFPFAHSTRVYPEWPMARIKQTSREIAEKVTAALLMINPESPAATAGNYAGWTIPANYEMVRNCLKELRIDPYRDYGRISIRDVFLRYWYWLVSIALLLSAMAVIIIHLRRTKYILKNEIAGRQNTATNLQLERAQLLSIFDSIEEIIYVSNPQTYEIIFTNKYLQNLLGEDPLGKICYRKFQNLDQPCDYCTNKILLRNKDESYHWEHYNSRLDKYFLITDRIIRWPDGSDVRFELAIDITERKEAEDQLKDYGATMEEMVNKKTAAMRKIVDLMAGREVRMMELKKVIRILRTQIEDIGMVPVADDPLKRGESDRDAGIDKR